MSSAEPAHVAEQPPQSRTSWVFDSHVLTEAATATQGKGSNPQALSAAWDDGRNLSNPWAELSHRERKETLLQIFETNPWVSNCIDTIALYITSGGFTLEPKKDNPSQKQHDEIQQFLLRINDGWDFNQYVYDMLTDDMIFGEAFTEFTMAGGKPYQLFSIDNITMDTKHDRYGNVLYYTQQLKPGDKPQQLKPDNIIRWWNPSKKAKVDPFSPLERIKDAVLLDKKMVNWSQSFFQKGAKFDYSVEFQGDRDEADRFLTWFRQNYTGEKNAHLPPVTYNGAKLNSMGKGSIDIDFDRGLDRQQIIVLSAFHVPPSIACIAESGNRLTDMSDGQRKILQYIACDPRRNRFFEKFNNRLIQPFWSDWKVNSRYADFRDDKSLAEVADINIKNGSLLIDEARQAAGKEAYKPNMGGDVPIIMIGNTVLPLERLGDMAEEQKQTAQQTLAQGDLNTEMLKAKVEQAKNPPPPPPMIQGQAPGQPPQAQQRPPVPPQAKDKQDAKESTQGSVYSLDDAQATHTEASVRETQAVRTGEDGSGDLVSDDDAGQSGEVQGAHAALAEHNNAATASLKDAIHTLFSGVQTRAGHAIREGQDAIHAYDLTMEEREKLINLLATNYSKAKTQAYKKAMETVRWGSGINWQGLDAQAWAETCVNSIIHAYHDALTTQIAKSKEEAYEPNGMEEAWIKDVLGKVKDWFLKFIDWKSEQIAEDTINSGDNDGTAEAITELLEDATNPNTPFTGDEVRVRVLPSVSSSDECKKWAGKNYSLADAMSLPRFPAHSRCIHYTRIYVVGGEQ